MFGGSGSSEPDGASDVFILSRFSGDSARVGCHSLGRDLTAQDDFNAETSIESRSVSQVGIFRKEAGRGESQDEESLHLAKIPQRNCKNCRPTCFHQVVLKGNFGVTSKRPS